MENVLSIVDMHKTYPGGVHAVRGVSFDVMEGGIGGNNWVIGSVKSTVLRGVIG